MAPRHCGNSGARVAIERHVLWLHLLSKAHRHELDRVLEIAAAGHVNGHLDVRAEPTQAASSVIVTLNHVDGKWLISAFDPV